MTSRVHISKHVGEKLNMFEGERYTARETPDGWVLESD